MNALFVNENTLGHASYLVPFANYFSTHPELGITPRLVNATPLPGPLEKKANRSIPLLRKFGLDMQFARWRSVASAHVRKLIESHDFDAILINTQSVALDLGDIRKPLFIALDATFSQLSRDGWQPGGAKMIAGLIRRERAIYNAAAVLLPWSRRAAQSLDADYGIAENKIFQMPPSVLVPPRRAGEKSGKLQALFVGGDFTRKGGDLLLETYRKYFRGKFDLNIITQSNVQPGEGIRVLKADAHTEPWRELWGNADLLIFPSKLETFGIVLVEALAFETPVISSRAGAAEEILLNGEAGLLLDELSVDGLAAAINNVLEDRAGALERARAGRQRAENEFNLERNSERLAKILRQQN